MGVVSGLVDVRYKLVVRLQTLVLHAAQLCWGEYVVKNVLRCFRMFGLIPFQIHGVLEMASDVSKKLKLVQLLHDRYDVLVCVTGAKHL